MKRQKFRTLSVALTGGVLALTASMAAPASAAAAETAYNTKTQYLVAIPDVLNPPSCQQREITLVNGVYEWGQVRYDGQYPLNPAFSLGAGTYTMTDCLSPTGGVPGFYEHTTTLDPHTAGWPTVTAERSWRPRLDGTYKWGSYLDPSF